MGRKTFNVTDFQDYVNGVLANSTTSPDGRQGLMNALEHVLFASGNYKGFKYLWQRDVPSGELPGIHINETGTVEGTPTEERFDPAKTDRTRVCYY